MIGGCSEWTWRAAKAVRQDLMQSSRGRGRLMVKSRQRSEPSQVINAGATHFTTHQRKHAVHARADPPCNPLTCGAWTHIAQACTVIAAHTRRTTLSCQSSERTATYSILIIVRGRGDSHQRSLPIKLHALCSINDRLHASTGLGGRPGKDASLCKLNLLPCGSSEHMLLLTISYLNNLYLSSVKLIFRNVLSVKGFWRYLLWTHQLQSCLSLTELIDLCSFSSVLFKSRFFLEWDFKAAEWKCMTDLTCRYRVNDLIRNALQRSCIRLCWERLKAKSDEQIVDRFRPV